MYVAFAVVSCNSILGIEKAELAPPDASGTAGTSSAGVAGSSASGASAGTDSEGSGGGGACPATPGECNKWLDEKCAVELAACSADDRCVAELVLHRICYDNGVAPSVCLGALGTQADSGPPDVVNALKNCIAPCSSCAWQSLFTCAFYCACMPLPDACPDKIAIFEGDCPQFCQSVEGEDFMDQRYECYARHCAYARYYDDPTMHCPHAVGESVCLPP